MSNPSILVLGYSEASMMLRGRHDRCAIISIYGQREYPLETEGCAHALVLRFDDVAAPDPQNYIETLQAEIRRRKDAEIGLNLRGPTIEDARTIIEFARKIQDQDGVLLCQCQGGMSRSAAAALLCLAAWKGEGAACVQELFLARPAAVPHRGLISLGEKVLGLSGKLSEALAAYRR